MKALASLVLLFAALPAGVNAMVHSLADSTASNERLGTVSFPVSCAAASQAGFNRGVALQHDFWYEEARAQFDRLVKSDPACAMAHWGVAMSVFHQIWDRPDPRTMQVGWAEMQQAESLTAGTAREKAYIAALANFFRPGAEEFPARIAAYSQAMGKLYAEYPGDVDAGAFYALSLLASVGPDDTSLAHAHKAMDVLVPLFERYPDNPGVVHYIIHACDNPIMAPEGLAAANHYGEIAQSGPHAFHMPGHIYARLGLWQQDIASQLGSIAASQEAEARGESGIMDEPHSYDFLLYAYLQSGQDALAKSALEQSGEPLKMLASMPGMGGGYMDGMIPYYRLKLPIFYDLERRDWQSAGTREPITGSSPQVSAMVYWSRAVAHGHLHRPDEARADLAHFDQLLAEIRKSKRAYTAEGTGTKIQRSEMLGWVAFAESKQDEAFQNMRAAADLQDKVGQGEVDIPAREMLADMLLESGHAQQALREYEIALKLSPNRLNGLYNAGRAAEAAGEQGKAQTYFAALMKSTNSGKDSSRPELAYARKFVSAAQTAAN
ncbi:tetratricopeptide repeat protein [Acidicapsa dinghuensis]|uniref:Tetratricopeptide repeat protein n=1 Tax=Acidicapsa dinghuensis TaxID=2218256 RepID=A0ABW1EFD8_9BACT|nr:tetratricopeptide repeat protein [Acidicapsa dinghuensis]